jgi:hypothetical protein
MKCPNCENDIECRLSIQTELEDRPIYINYQWWECKSCTKKYFGILEDSRINIFDDTLEHIGYYANEEDWVKTLNWAQQCPNPKNTQCKCSIHQQVPPSGFYGDSAWYTND